jgi:hypothetical protein
MARIIHTGETPAKRRHALSRSCAEVIRLLAQKASFDDEARDMCAFLVFNLREIYSTIDASAQTWDERNYWKKAEKLRSDYRWAVLLADRMRNLIVDDDWPLIPDLLIQLAPHFAQITINTVTRDADWWCGAHRALLREAREKQEQPGSR